MKKIAVVVLLSAMSLTAYALTKEERDLLKETAPAMAEANAKFKSSCGCNTPITIDESTIKSKDDIYNFKHMAEEITAEAPKYCTDAASKKAMCQLKSLTFARANEAVFKFNGGRALLTEDGQSHATWDMMSRELDK